jgi:hypothetical protein
VTIGDGLFRGARSEVGQGYPIDPKLVPQLIDVVYAAFEAGLVLSSSPENIVENGAVAAIDMEVDRGGKLIRSPGLLLVEDAAPRNLRYTFQHSNLDYGTELVTIDPPFFGFKGGGAYTWVNAGLPATGIAGWAVTNYAGTLIISNGTSSYTRLPGGGVLTDVTAQVAARALAVVFGRIFAGYYMAGINPQSLGIKWNSVAGGVDFAGTGANAEFLLSDAAEADKIVAMLPIGLDVLSILNRKSLWIGYPTGDAYRPADPRVKVQSLGCVSADTARITARGVTFLSDEGVATFNLQGVEIISQEINDELLPLDYTRISQYTATFIPTLQRYILTTPFCVWIYEGSQPSQGGQAVRPSRWFKRSLIANSVLNWSNQVAGGSWDTIPGTWDQQTLTWEQMALAQSDSPGLPHFTIGSKLVREDRSSFSNLGIALTPLWRTPQSSKTIGTDQYATIGFEISYKSIAAASVRLSANDQNGTPGTPVVKSLPVTGGIYKKFIIFNETTGMGVQAQIEVVSGDPMISRIRQMVLPSGPTLVAL